MTKVFFQDRAGNAPMVAAFVPYREARAILSAARAELVANGVRVISHSSQSIIAANGAKYWLG